MSTIQPYDVLPHESNPLLTHYEDIAVPLDTYPYHFMTKMCGEKYKGGMWEFRKYPNGAVCMVFPDSTEVEPITFNGNYVTCSMEAVSYGIWLMTLSMISMELAEKKPDHPLRDYIHDQYHGLLDALAGRVRFMITKGEGDGCRDLTEEELDLIVPRLSKHPELSEIAEIID